MATKNPLPRSLLPRTLRGRLIAGLVALLAVACATVGLVTYLAVDRALTGDLKGELQTATGLAYQCWEQAFHKINEQGQGDNGAGQDGGGAASGSSTAPSPSPSPSAAPGGSGADSLSSAIDSSCTGLAERTFVAVHLHDQLPGIYTQWPNVLFGSAGFTLSTQDEQSLSSIHPWRAPQTHQCGDHTLPNVNFPAETRYLSWPQGTFLITAILDPDCDTSVYYTGLPLSGQHDFLTDVAFAEAAVFSAVLLFAGVIGTVWVRFSLRPLRRVAVTASQVAELPLESGEVSLPAGVPDTDPATETGQVGLAFNRMLGHVENALRRRAASETRLRRFAADASHELRTPLAAIRGYAELALRHPGDTPDTVTHALGRVLSESKRMSVLVDDLLLLARLDAGRPLNKEPVDMTRLAIEATSDAQVARPSHRWVLELPDDSELVLGDEHRLRQVLVNLLSNAGRHTPEGSTVTVRVSGILPEGEPGRGPESVAHGKLPAPPRLVISVTDNGPGIPTDLLPDLFERFTRADTSRSHAVNASSTGLGLAIVDAVVAAHHGALLVTSRPGMTRFTLVLAQLAETTVPPAPTRTARRLLTRER
jgi:two-component system OmpR family sensor kinase